MTCKGSNDPEGFGDAEAGLRLELDCNVVDSASVPGGGETVCGPPDGVGLVVPLPSDGRRDSVGGFGGPATLV